MFVDISASTTDQLKSVDKSIFEIELNLCQMIQFDQIVFWSDQSSIWEKTSLIEPNGITNPLCIYQNSSTKHLFQQCDVMFFLTDGQIEHQNVSKVISMNKISFFIESSFSLVFLTDRK